MRLKGIEKDRETNKKVPLNRCKGKVLIIFPDLFDCFDRNVNFFIGMNKYHS